MEQLLPPEHGQAQYGRSGAKAREKLRPDRDPRRVPKDAWIVRADAIGAGALLEQGLVLTALDEFESDQVAYFTRCDDVVPDCCRGSEHGRGGEHLDALHLPDPPVNAPAEQGRVNAQRHDREAPQPAKDTRLVLWQEKSSHT